MEAIFSPSNYFKPHRYIWLSFSALSSRYVSMSTASKACQQQVKHVSSSLSLHSALAYANFRKLTNFEYYDFGNSTLAANALPLFQAFSSIYNIYIYIHTYNIYLYISIYLYIYMYTYIHTCTYIIF